MSEREDNGVETREHRLAGVRLAFVALGTLFVALGILGAFLPVLPTTPFLLLAAACYARGSARLHDALLGNRTFGPLILEWHRHRSIPYRVKLTAIVLMAAALALSTAALYGRPWLQGWLAALGVLLAIYLWRIPSRDRPPR